MLDNEMKGDDLARLSGVSGPTITRFLAGKIADPSTVTVRKLAEVFKISEAQLRGLEPIPGITVDNPGEEPIKLRSILTREELETIEHMRSLGKQTRKTWLEMGWQLRASEQIKETTTTRKCGVSGVTYRNPNQKEGDNRREA